MTTFLFGLGALLLTLPILTLVAMILMAFGALVWFLVLTNINIIGHLISCASPKKGEAVIAWVNERMPGGDYA